MKKRGRTTGLTGGIVEAVELSGSINNHDGTLFRNYAHVMRIRPNPDAGGVGTVFDAPGDSGSAIVNDSGQVVGILFGVDGSGAGLAIPLDLIIAKFDMMPGAQRLQLRLATATTNNDIRVVPRIALETARSLAEVPAKESAFVPQLEQDLSRSDVGRWYLDAYLRHAQEVRELINRNRKVATMWHRSGAAELFQSLVQITRRHDSRVPELVQGRSITDILRQMGSVLAQYGSFSLRQDLAEAQPRLPLVAGLTYPEILERLNDFNTASPTD